MKYFILTETLRDAEFLARLLGLPEWKFVHEASDLYGHSGFIVIQETDRFQQHRNIFDIQSVLDNRVAEGKAAVWQISLDWLARRR